MVEYYRCVACRSIFIKDNVKLINTSLTTYDNVTYVRTQEPYCKNCYKILKDRK